MGAAAASPSSALIDDRLLSELFRFGIQAEIAPLDSRWDCIPAAFFPCELDLLGAAVSKRRRELIAGRTLAHGLMERLGRGLAPVNAGTDRSPTWPRGLTGSISHTDQYCWVAMAELCNVDLIGVDVERCQPLQPDLWQHICRDDELLAAGRAADPGLWVRLLFCAKEAFYKAQYPLTRKFLSHTDVAVDMDAAAGKFHASCVDSDDERLRNLEGIGLLSSSSELLSAAWLRPV